MNSGLRGIAPADVFPRPTADQIWLGPTQVSALSLLLEPAGTASVSSMPGCGRSLLLQRVGVEAAREGALVLNLDGGTATVRRALSGLLAGAGLNGSHLGPIDQRNLLHLVVGERLREKRRVLVLVDDADRLEPAIIEELERLSLFSEPGGGRLELRYAFNPERLNSEAALQLDLNARCAELQPLDDDQIRNYVDWRLGLQGLEGLFTVTALRLGRRYTRGALRAVDSLLRLALLMMQRAGARRVGVQFVDDAAKQLTRLGAARRAKQPAVQAQPVRSQPAAYLPGEFIVTEYGAPLMRVPLRRRLLIGRNPGNEVCITGSEVSRYHAMVEVVGDRVEIVDLNSANGVWVNGERHREAVLRDSDVISIGPFKLKLVRDESHAVIRAAAASEALLDTIVMGPSAASARSHLKSV